MLTEHEHRILRAGGYDPRDWERLTSGKWKIGDVWWFSDDAGGRGVITRDNVGPVQNWIESVRGGLAFRRVGGSLSPSSEARDRLEADIRQRITNASEKLQELENALRLLAVRTDEVNVAVGRARFAEDRMKYLEAEIERHVLEKARLREDNEALQEQLKAAGLPGRKFNFT